METSEEYAYGEEQLSEIERLTRENEQLRATVSKTATAIGAVVSPECSVDFMALLPDEARAKVVRLTRERDEAREQAANHANRSEESRAYAQEQRERAQRAEAEVDRLRAMMRDLHMDELTDHYERAEAAEAEVERLVDKANRYREEREHYRRFAMGFESCNRARQAAEAEVERLREVLDAARDCGEPGWCITEPDCGACKACRLRLAIERADDA